MHICRANYVKQNVHSKYGPSIYMSYKEFKSRYAVKNSDKKYAGIISTHRTLGAAYKIMVRHHREHYKNHKFLMSQPVICVIATEASKEIIRSDIESWRTFGWGPRSRRRLPLTIVVHQWDRGFNGYIRFGEIRTND